MKVGLSDVALLWLSSSSFSNKRAKIMKRNAINRHKRQRKKSLLLGGFYITTYVHAKRINAKQKNMDQKEGNNTSRNKKRGNVMKLQNEIKEIQDASYYYLVNALAFTVLSIWGEYCLIFFSLTYQTTHISRKTTSFLLIQQQKLFFSGRFRLNTVSLQRRWICWYLLNSQELPCQLLLMFI